MVKGTKDDQRKYQREYMRKYRLSSEVKKKEAEYSSIRYWTNENFRNTIKIRQKTDEYKQHVREYNNRPEIIERNKEYNKSDKRKELNRIARLKPERKKWQKEYNKKYRKEHWNEMLLNNIYKYHTDLEYRLKSRLRSRISTVLKTQNAHKDNHTLELLGCTLNELKLHLEKQFVDGMNWNNYGRNGWHIDHIIPCTYFDLAKIERRSICFNYRNLQPLWESDNCIKHDTLPENYKVILKNIKLGIKQYEAKLSSVK
jgi:hypothetical protein